MDSELRKAKLVWKATGEKLPFLQALLRAGREDLLDQLVSLYDGQACLIRHGKDLIADTEQNSDHLDAVCPCLACITVAQLQERLGKLWSPFLSVFKELTKKALEDPKQQEDLISRTCERGMFRTTPALIDVVVWELESNVSFRRQAVEILVKQLLEKAA